MASIGSARKEALPLAEGIKAGLIGAASIAIWFLLVDVVRGRPLFTPSLLGTALFRGPSSIGSPESVPVSAAMVLLFTVAHGLVFIGIGLLAALLVRLAERNANYGFGIVLLLVFVLSGFIFVSMVFASELLHALSWPAVLSGNLLAVIAMAMYFKRQHPGFTMRP